MKITLTRVELSETLRATYPVPAGYELADVTIKPYSDGDFCVVELSRVVEPAPVAEVAGAQ